MNNIFMRHSVRKFEDRPVGAEKIEKLLRAAMQAPSAGNGQPWEFVTVQDRANLKKLAESSPYAGCAAAAPLAIVILHNPAKGRYPEYWQQDCAAAAQNILLEAVELGLGGVWLAVSPDPQRMEFFRRWYGLENGVEVFAILPIGYPAEGSPATPNNKFTDRFDPSRIHREIY